MTTGLSFDTWEKRRDGLSMFRLLADEIELREDGVEEFDERLLTICTEIVNTFDARGYPVVVYSAIQARESLKSAKFAKDRHMGHQVLCDFLEDVVNHVVDAEVEIARKMAEARLAESILRHLPTPWDFEDEETTEARAAAEEMAAETGGGGSSE